jgi:ribosomal protein S18 acetylase RimI-like enzyme
MVRRLVPPRAEPQGPRVRAATLEDRAFVQALSVEVFNQFGDYGNFLPGYLSHPSVFTSIYDDGGAALGFVMIALVLSDEPLASAAPRSLPPAENDEEDRWLDAEILAIAVSPGHQARGIGRRLMEHALDFARAWHRSSGVRSVQLNVADTNTRAYEFFLRHGFRVLDADDGSYPRGQRSIRMLRTLEGY